MNRFALSLRRLGCILLAFPALAGAQTLVNGSFVDDNVGWVANSGYQGRNGTSNLRAAGSTVPVSPVDQLSGIDTMWAAYNLTSSLPAGGYRGISQSISGFTVGQAYQVSFYEAASNFSSTPESASLWWEVQLGSESHTSTVLTAPDPKSGTAWTKVVLTFTATAATETLAFLAHASAPVAPEPQLLLDGITLTPVSAVPEPAQWALFAGGGLALFMLHRRRSNRR